ncbi:mannosyltransferase [Lactarius deliciosus]|nr:mannosyltransferase [Lactarius deliciosus]
MRTGERRSFIGFFHPYCNAGGGGERVLWTAVALMQRTEPDVISVVYSGDTDATKEQIIAKVKTRFDITLAPDTLHFVFLESRQLVEDRAWPRFTLLGQSLGSMYLAWEAMSKFVPDLYIGIIVSSCITTRLPLRSSSFLMVNSSWTKNHVDAILAHSDPLLDFIHLPLNFIGGLALSIVHALASSSPARAHAAPRRAAIVYPPCNTLALSQFPLDGTPVAPIEPEKDHACTDSHDGLTTAALSRAPPGCTITVEFVVNAPYPRILELLGHASVGLNTMVDEHFGINVVEFMAAGVIPVVHASGGPLRDIVVPVDGLRTGFHAKDPESFAQAVHEVMVMSEEERRSIRARARQWATTTFSQDAFEKGWTQSGWSRWL